MPIQGFGTVSKVAQRCEKDSRTAVN